MNKLKVGDRVYPDGSEHILGTIIRIIWDDFVCVQWDILDGPLIHHYDFILLEGEPLGSSNRHTNDYFSSQEYKDISNKRSLLAKGYGDFLEKIDDRLK